MSRLEVQTVQGKHNFKFHLSYVSMVFHKELHGTVKNGITFVVVGFLNSDQHSHSWINEHWESMKQWFCVIKGLSTGHTLVPGSTQYNLPGKQWLSERAKQITGPTPPHLALFRQGIHAGVCRFLGLRRAGVLGGGPHRSLLLKLGLFQRVDHQLHDCLMDAQCPHQVRVLEEYLVVHQISATPHPLVLDTVRFCMLREAHQHMFLITIMRLPVSQPKYQQDLSVFWK